MPDFVYFIAVFVIGFLSAWIIRSMLDDSKKTKEITQKQLRVYQQSSEKIKRKYFDKEQELKQKYKYELRKNNIAIATLKDKNKKLKSKLFGLQKLVRKVENGEAHIKQLRRILNKECNADEQV